MLNYDIQIELEKENCSLRVYEYVNPSIYFDIDELKRLDFKIVPEKSIDIEIPAES